MKYARIQRSATMFLQVVIVLIAVGTLAALLIEPHFEGRNANATVFAIYFNDPFLAYAYLGSIPSFVALYQAFRFLRYAGQNKASSQDAMHALRIIRYCMLITAGAIVAVAIYLRIAAIYSTDDSAGVLMLGIIATFITVVIAAGAATLEAIVKSAADTRFGKHLAE